MQINVLVYSEELSIDDVKAVLQAIRDTERQRFPEKMIRVFVHAPGLGKAQCQEILSDIKPPFPNMDALDGGIL